MDKVFIENLRTDCIVGILPWERSCEQPLLCSVYLEYPSLKKAGRQADLSLSADYGALSKLIVSYVKKRHAGLLEELGTELCDLIVKEFAPAAVTVRLSKPQALPEAGAAGIEISRTGKRTGSDDD